jgi:gas vesicle protein
MSKDSSAGFFSGLIVGGMVGAFVALLYAPQPGPETRKVVKEKALEIKEKAAKAISSKVKVSPVPLRKKKRARKPVADKRRRLI